jgi:hypothetical protein
MDGGIKTGRQSPRGRQAFATAYSATALSDPRLG